MAVKFLFTTRMKRYACASLASGVTTFMAFYASPLAAAQDSPCTLRDVTAWQMALTDSSQERSPAYMLDVTKPFLEACPDRPEAKEAARIAGIASADLGKAEQAARYFGAAEPMFDLQSKFYQISALLASGQDSLAWRKRDEMIASWLISLKRHRDIKVETRTLRVGTIHILTFDRIPKSTGTRSVWVGVPRGAGWPAALSMGSDPQTLALHRIRAGADADKLRHVDLYRCSGRKILARRTGPISDAEFDVAAETTLLAYLSKPDTYRAAEPSRPLNVCLWPSRILPKPTAE